MADTKIIDMTDIVTPIGTDVLPIVRNGNTTDFNVSMNEIAGYAATNITIDPTVTATGTDQASAYLVSDAATIFDTVSSGTGARLPAWSATGHYTIINRGSSTLLLYPASGAQIESLGINTPTSIVINSSVVAWADATGVWRISPVGSVMSVAQSFTGGLISVGGSPITGSGTLALTVAGTSGGVPYFDSATSWASSGALAAGSVMLGGGAGNPPTVAARGQLPATATNDNATAGNIGEYAVLSVSAGASVPIANSGTAVNVGTLSLTAGDWDVRGNVGISAAASTQVTRVLGGINLVSATIPSSGQPGAFNMVQGFTGANSVVVPLDTVRVSIASTTTVYLVANASFTISTAAAFGSMSARRVR